jgi:hypothetical protein
MASIPCKKEHISQKKTKGSVQHQSIKSAMRIEIRCNVIQLNIIGKVKLKDQAQATNRNRIMIK